MTPSAPRLPTIGLPSAPPVQVLFIVLPDTLLLDLAGPAEAFRLANQQLARRGLPAGFDMRFAGPEAAVTSSVGLGLAALSPLPEQLTSPTWVVLLGRPGDALQVVRHQGAWLATRDWLGRVLAPALAVPGTEHRLLTVCVGALLAADAGLLTERQVTTHHELLADLALMAPGARVLPNRVFVCDGPVWSSAGITAGIDLALHLIAERQGEGLASAVAQVMVVFHRRGSEDPERSPLLAGRRHLHPAVHAVQNAVVDAPGEDWTLDRMAALAHVTPRHLSRLFQQHAGLSPREHVEQVRLALAVEARAAGLAGKQAAALGGFSSERQWRRARQRSASPATAKRAPA
ncbi:helix-turn-helix domain-containing protein [Ideonella azotifigens]|uniref:Helix-turn-helix domain-containing protein n=2 Tax=Ideonella azotifigens TaxID=513160 RepID=A0ABP3VHX6_9BURK|nr:helix-turn-helix domain-containing protein [Ideonella azotifigens]MCD2342450.1 helix-turn-helix domain-containing protein [Ideonella azotifigens]